jgi:hypothetical protein
MSIKLYRKKMVMVFVLLMLSQIQLSSLFIQAATTAPVTPKLLITAAMSAIPSDGRVHPTIIIGIDDGKGKPLALREPLNVTLASSDNAALVLPERVTLPVAACFYIVNGTSNAVGSKQVEVSASASGFVSAKATISVGPPAGIPTSLDVTILPNVILPISGEKVDILVTLVDSYGNPTQARSDLVVTLFSSDPNTATVSSGSIIIPAGSIEVKTTLVSTGREGTTTVTASTSNLKSDTATLTVTGPQPTKITLWALSKLPAYDPSNILFVGITDSDSNPVKLLAPKVISLYTSNAAVVTLQSSITIPAGQWSAIVPLNCGRPNGTSTISAAAKDLSTATISVGGTALTSNSTASLKLYSMALGFPADEINQNMLVVQRLDAEGMPTKASGSLGVDFYSASSDIVEIGLFSTIKAGESAAVIKATTKLPGTTVITGGSATIGSASANVKSYMPVPDKILIQTPPIASGGAAEACLITLKGNTPAPVAQSTLIQLTSSDTQVGGSDVDSVVLAEKTYMKYLKVEGTSPGQFSLTVSASGIPSQKVTLKVLDTEPSTFKLTSVKPVSMYDFPIIIQMCNAGGNPSVSSTPVQVDIVASNATNIVVPSKVVIKGDNSELVFLAKAYSTKATSVTVSSPGFKSITLALSPGAAPIAASLVMSSKMPINKPTNVQFTLTVNGQPVEGAEVSWHGIGFNDTISFTGPKGVASNSFTLVNDEQFVSAMVNVGSGYISASKTITSVPDAYHLVVTANVPGQVGGSGTYSYGEEVMLEAPMTEPMPHVLGLLGGKYVFVEWTGVVSTTSNSVTYKIAGDKTELSAQAMYNSDYNTLMIVVGVIAVLVIAGFLGYRKFGDKLRARFLKKKPEDPKPVVKPSPVRH